MVWNFGIVNILTAIFMPICVAMLKHNGSAKTDN